jgi:DNA adenine methylase
MFLYGERWALARNQSVQPFLKWAGGKRQLLHEIKKHIPDTIHTYYEPFFGGGAVLFALRPQKAVINDINPGLINACKVVRDHVDELITSLSACKNDREYYYSMRDLDRQDKFRELSDVERAARLIYLNKICYNGLFRVNSQGQFNVPFGNYKNPNIVNEAVLRSVHYYLTENSIEILNTDFADAVATAQEGDFVYLDPPYDPVSDTSSFTSYSLERFGQDEQIRLRNTFASLSDRGCKVLLSNSATDFIRDLYRDYHVRIVEAGRNINSKISRRGKIDELLVMNFGIE